MEIESNYRKIEKIGEGAYGAVYRAINTQTNQTVALKVSRFDDFDEGVPSTCMRQIAILKNLKHPNLVKLLDSQVFKGSEPRLQLVFEYVDFDLSKYCKFRTEEMQKSLTESQAKNIIKSILSGIHYLHCQGILHRDLKPHNILISSEGVIKIADFGLGRICSYPLETMSKEIQTLWYRAPELLLGTKKYGQGVDIWSIGCIFYELVQGKALFQAESQIGQLFEVFKVIGTPHLKDWPEIVEMEDFRPSFPKFDPRPLEVRKLSIEGQEWISKVLKANPKQRMTLFEAMNDKYLQYI